MTIPQLIHHLAPRGSFAANVLTLMTGTALAQGLMIAISPLLSRIYTPEDFGVYSLYAAIVVIVGSVVSLNYEMAIVLPKRHDDAVNVAALSIAVSIGLAILTVVVLAVVPLKLLYPANPEAITSWIWVLPVSVIALGVAGTLESWCTRMKLFNEASTSKVCRAVTTAVVQVSAGYKGVGPLGLIYGAVLGDIAASAGMAWLVARQNVMAHVKSVSWAGMAAMARKYIDFPLYSSSQNLLNAVSLSAPAFFLTYFYGIKIAGFYLLGIKLIQVPSDLVSRSFRQVFYQKAAEVHNEAGNLFGIFKKSTIRLFTMAIIPSAVLFCFAPEIFKVVLGPEWETAGVYSRWLVLWVCVNFANVPAVSCYRILNMQARLFWIYVFYLAFRIAALVAGGLYGTAELTVAMFAGVGLFFNIIIIASIWNRLSRQAAR